MNRAVHACLISKDPKWVLVKSMPLSPCCLVKRCDSHIFALPKVVRLCSRLYIAKIGSIGFSNGVVVALLGVVSAAGLQMTITSLLGVQPYVPWACCSPVPLFPRFRGPAVPLDVRGSDVPQL